MRVHRQDASITVQAPAKLNLFFEVIAKRSDGFHEIESLMVPVSLYDSLMFRAEPEHASQRQDSAQTLGGVTLECHWAGDQKSAVGLGVLPPAAENLATRAVLLLRGRAGIQQGCSMRLIKRIPSAAGLGGGSSDAAAALLAANIGWRLDWPRERLMELAAELGSDVPFFLAGGAAVCRGRGERIEPVGQLGCLHGVIVRPPEGLSTARVYGHCRPGRPSRSVQPLVAALRRGDLRRMRELVFNRLEEAAVDLCPWIGRLQQEFAQLNCVAAQMSGSGTSYFAICQHARHARHVAGRLRCRGVGRVYAVRL
jgi:4-diphosphocytidyl-2-C-methyl-D-erythritol kinase